MAHKSTNPSDLYLNQKRHQDKRKSSRSSHSSSFLQKIGQLSETSKLPDSFFAGLDSAIVSSGFWNLENSPDDMDMINVGKGLYVSQTDAAEKLGESIQDFFNSQSFPITIAVNSVEPSSQNASEEVKFPIGKGHKLYPNGIVVGGEQAISDGRFVMYLHLAPVDASYDASDVNPSNIASKIARIIRHELVHTQQFEKRRKKNKSSRTDALKKYDREGQIPDKDAPREKYLGSYIEIDAYAHEFAEELLTLLGKEKALSIVSKSMSLSKLEALGISDTLIEYLGQHNDAHFTKKLRGKIYTQITDMVERGLYENKNRIVIIDVKGVPVIAEIADCDKARRVGLMNRSALGENTGMLFIFPESRQRSFWMKETYLPLSIAYLESSGTIVNIEKMTPLDQTSIHSQGPAKYALEMNEGWFKVNNIHVGDIINIAKILHEDKMSETIVRKYIRELLSESLVSHVDEPRIGERVENTNPKCKHYGSEGVVQKINTLLNDKGKTVVYKCTNSGAQWSKGDILEKTLDQLDRV
jgi:uncharacterized protein